MRKLTKRQEVFCLKYHELGNAAEAARQAGYALKNVAFHTSQILNSPVVKARLEELKQTEEQLRQELELASVMSVLERKQRLTVIARANLTDFMELGKDGSWVNIGPESPQAGAIQEIHSRTEYDKDGSKPTVYTSVKLHDPIKAIDLLNKMEKMYSDGYQDNRQVNRVVNIYVLDNETKDLISKVAERTLQIGNANNQGIQSDSEGVGGRQDGNTT